MAKEMKVQQTISKACIFKMTLLQTPAIGPMMLGSERHVVQIRQHRRVIVVNVGRQPLVLTTRMSVGARPSYTGLADASRTYMSKAG